MSEHWSHTIQKENHLLYYRQRYNFQELAFTAGCYQCDNTYPLYSMKNLDDSTLNYSNHCKPNQGQRPPLSSKHVTCFNMFCDWWLVLSIHITLLKSLSIQIHAGKHVIKCCAASGPEHSASCSFTLFPHIDLTLLKILWK